MWCAAWLGIVYKASFVNFTAARGWLTPAEWLIGSSRPSLLHASTWLAQASNPELPTAGLLIEQALHVHAE
jgi:hypothetical protein